MSYFSQQSTAAPTPSQSYLLLLQATARLNLSGLELESGGVDVLSGLTGPRVDHVAPASACSGEVLELADKDEIIKALECPVCKEVCVPPIWNCDKGHILCNTCRPQLSKCALCKSPMSESRNYPLEAIAVSSKFQCQYKPEGCMEILIGDKYTDHVLNCSFRFVRHGSGLSDLGLDLFEVPLPQYDASSSDSDSVSSVSEESVSDTFQSVAWVRAENGHFPSNPVVGGTSANGEDLYVIRAYEGQIAVSGHLCPSDRAAFIVFQNRIRRKWYYDVLVAIPGSVSWIDYRDDGERNPIPIRYPSGTVVAKDDTCLQHKYVVGRVRMTDGRWVCGTVPPPSPPTQLNTCYYKDERRLGSSRRRFQILVQSS